MPHPIAVRRIAAEQQKIANQASGGSGALVATAGSNPNDLMHQLRRRKTIAVDGLLGVAVAGGFPGYEYLIGHHGMLTTIIGVGFGLFGMIATQSIITSFQHDALDPLARTWPSGHHPHIAATHVKAALTALVRATREGIPPYNPNSARAHIQSQIKEACDILERMGGEPPWLLVDRGSRRAVPDTLERRGIDLEQQGEALVGLIGQERAPSIEDLAAAMRNVLPSMVAIAGDFGLDPLALAKPRRVVLGLAHTSAEATMTTILPVGRIRRLMRNPDEVNTVKAGLGVDEKGNIFDMSTPFASHGEPETTSLARPQDGVLRLATEWNALSPSDPPTITSELADAAAGPDLDAIDEAWTAARAISAPAEWNAIDAEFSEACATLSAAISDGLAERVRTARDALSTQTRYVAAKHPRWSSPLNDAKSIPSGDEPCR